MRILMLGWEFPPFIAGGLGVACYGLSRALDQLGHQIAFVLPRTIHATGSTHVRLLGPQSALPHDASSSAMPGRTRLGVTYRRDDFQRTVFHAVPAAFANPYGQGLPAATNTAPERSSLTSPHGSPTRDSEDAAFRSAPQAMSQLPFGESPAHYSGDLPADAERYARLVVALSRHEVFDVIHAHDWLTFPAAEAVSAVSGKPWVAHVHSTEFDRSGGHHSPRVVAIERHGLHSASRVLVVSEWTKSICTTRYEIPTDRIDVIYNGIDPQSLPAKPPHIASTDREPVVLFLGRITVQKGPEYFLLAAKQVLAHEPRVRFVVAGAGDMEQTLRRQSRELGIESKVVFTGFLRGPDVDRALQLADCFVMPSVSEPFGLVALEAAQRGVPVLISKQSGVAEVLHHVLKFDYWDTDDLTGKILAVLRSPGLASTLAGSGSRDLLALSWGQSAGRCVESYERVLMTQTAVRA